MTEQLKVYIIFVCFVVYLAVLFLLLDYLLKREARRQFYRDLVRLVMLYEQNDLSTCSVQVPKILGPRIVHFASYDAVINDLSNAYYAGLTDYQSMSAYVLSLHRSYCYTDRAVFKLKNKLLNEKSNGGILT